MTYLKTIKYNRLEWLLMLIFVFELIFPQHTVKAAEASASVQTELSEAPVSIPFRQPGEVQAAGIETDETDLGFTYAPKVKSVDRIMVTAYNSEVGQCDSNPFITASGTWTRDGVVASNFYTIGTQVRFPDVFGDKVFTVEDRMNARYSKRVDIWMPDHGEAVKFGAKYLKIEVLVN